MTLSVFFRFCQLYMIVKRHSVPFKPWANAQPKNALKSLCFTLKTITQSKTSLFGREGANKSPEHFLLKVGEFVSGQSLDVGALCVTAIAWKRSDELVFPTIRRTLPHRICYDELFDTFSGHLVSKNGYLEWPPRSPVLTVPDFFLGSYLKIF